MFIFILSKSSTIFSWIAYHFYILQEERDSIEFDAGYLDISFI